MPGSGPGTLTKADYEAFRVEKFGQPLESAMEEPDSSQEGDEGDRPGADDEGDLTADCSRVILHFDAGESGGCLCVRVCCTSSLCLRIGVGLCLGRLLRVRLCPVSRLFAPSPSSPCAPADCFYAQVEELRDPSLRTKPLGISQKYLVVTCNYPARQGGVTKLMNIEEAKKKCVRASPTAACVRLAAVAMRPCPASLHLSCRPDYIRSRSWCSCRART
jgi:hypothetical protein